MYYILIYNGPAYLAKYIYIKKTFLKYIQTVIESTNVYIFINMYYILLDWIENWNGNVLYIISKWKFYIFDHMEKNI